MDIGQKQEVSLREIWPKEDKDFTPWLSENLELLGEELGIDIELIEKEHSVGTFFLDILAREINTDRPIAIENQLKLTDHTHLGQIVTYASGIGKSGIGVWICTQFSDQHQKALEWLNDNSDWDFFGIELRAFSIDGSNPAPFFNIVVEPNEWSRAQKLFEKAKISPTNEAYRSFWSELLEKFKERYPGITNASGKYPQSWCGIPAGKTGLYFSWAFRLGNRFHTELYIDFGDKSTNKEFFDRLYNKKEMIENGFGDRLSWERLDDKKASRIAYYYDNASIKAIPDDLMDWAIDNMKRLRDSLLPIINETVA
jgi:hypothetical protein